MAERTRKHEDDLEMSEAINLAMDEYQSAAYLYGCAVDGMYASEPECDKRMSAMNAARDALIIAIADRVREGRNER